VDFACGLLRPTDLLRAGREAVVLRPGGDRRVRLSMTTAAMEDLWDEMHAPLLRLIGRHISDPRDAEDVLQDVMLRIHRHAGEMDEFEHLGAWIKQVTRNAIIDFYRRRAARREQPAGTSAEVDEFRVPAPSGPTAPDVAGTELARCLRPLVARLPDKYREALEVTEFDGLSQVAAAERLGLSTSGMKARVQRARTQLRDSLLECCEVELDRRGSVAGYRLRGDGCARCGAGQDQSHPA
jgi:RNA polymerase sigma-70 factor (ECF subfamily)